MWKESYRIGIDRIDQQHMELFRMADGLLKNIESNAPAEAFQKAIAFLKEYVVFHFCDEEEYQASIQYGGMTEHQKAHMDFTGTVLEFEKRLNDSNYEIGVLKELAGTLTAWLIYHVADADQKIAGKGEKLTSIEARPYLESFSVGLKDVLEKMAGLDAESMKEEMKNKGPIDGAVFVSVGVVGDVPGSAVFGFSKELAFKLIEIMTFSQPEEIDELVCSALAELSNITSGNVAAEFCAQGLACDITTPAVSMESAEFMENIEGVCIDTGVGNLEITFRQES